MNSAVVPATMAAPLRRDARTPVRKFQKTTKSISKMSRRAAVRYGNIFSSARNPFTAV
jgi:hypothetical protein